MLHREFPGRISAAHTRPIDVERFGQYGIVLAPLVENDLGDLQFIPIAEDTGVGSVLHQRQRIAQHQLIRREASVTLTGGRLGNDAAYSADISLVRYELQFDRQGDKFLQGQIGAGRYAQKPVLQSAAQRLASRHPLDQQDVVEDTFPLRQPQAYRTIYFRQPGKRVCQILQVHALSPF